MYIVLLISICYCFMHNHALSPFPIISPLLYHDSYSIIVYRFMYSTLCYLPTSLYCLISCEFLVFYICLARVRCYFYYQVKLRNRNFVTCTLFSLLWYEIKDVPIYRCKSFKFCTLGVKFRYIYCS